VILQQFSSLLCRNKQNENDELRDLRVNVVAVLRQDNAKLQENTAEIQQENNIKIQNLHDKIDSSTKDTGEIRIV
jgi:hypothetical protein